LRLPVTSPVQRLTITQVALLAVFTLSGFAGLIYESIWSQYLKLFLGHAAYAQTLVLAIFMGGMAIGSLVVGQTSHRIRRLLQTYAVVELVIGVLGCHWCKTTPWRGRSERLSGVITCRRPSSSTPNPCSDAAV